MTPDHILNGENAYSGTNQRYCSVRTPHTNKPTEACSDRAENLVWMFDGICYWYCEEHTSKALELHDGAWVAAP